MSFINKSVNYSETVLLKTKYLSPLLHKFNNFISQQNTNLLSSSDYYIIPNNHKKFYLYTLSKQNLENCKENYNIFYFFPDSKSLDFYKKENLSDFYIETNLVFEDSYVFEGYLYEHDDRWNYLISDILLKNDQIITFDYTMRFSIINEIIIPKLNKLTKINNHMNISIHPIIHSENENMVQVFIDNFIFNTNIVCIEHIFNFNKTQYVHSNSDEQIADQTKKIQKGQFSDVYNVYNISSGEYEGILYVKTLQDSINLKKQLKNSDNIYVTCKYNSKFNKWEVKF